MLELALSEIKKIEGLVYNDDSYISLSQGALKVGGIPIEIKTHLTHLLQSDVTDYYKSAWGIPALRTKIADNLSKRYTCTIPENNIIVSHGSIGALSAVFATLTQPGDEIIIPEPAYPAYQTLSIANRCTPKFVPLVRSKQTWSFDFEALEQALTPKTRFILISNPWNPMGNVVSKHDLEQLIALCEKHRVYLISDEVYEDYLFDTDFHSATPHVMQSEWVVRTGSFSKNYSMSGWRVGFMVVPDIMVMALGQVQDAQLNCPNVFAQHAALFALDHPELIKRNYDFVKQSRGVALTLLQPLVDNGIISFTPSQAGFNLFIKTLRTDAQQFVTTLCKEQKVTVVPGFAFGPSGNDYFRLCYARKPEVVRRGVQKIVEHLSAMPFSKPNKQNDAVSVDV